jgi:hypothetical protein
MNKKIISILLLLLLSYLLFSKDDIYEGFAFFNFLRGKDQKCGSDAAEGKCILESKRMIKECPKECLQQAKRLEQIRPSPEQTKDTHHQCWKWAMTGECKDNPAYMTSFNGCKQSCEIIYKKYDLTLPVAEESKNIQMGDHPLKNIQMGDHPLKNIQMGDHPLKNIQMGDHPLKNISLKNVSNNISLKNNDSVCSNKNENRIDCIKKYIFRDGLYGGGVHPGDKEGKALFKLLNTSADELNMSIQDRNDAISIMLQDVIKALHGPTGDRALQNHLETHKDRDSTWKGIPPAPDPPL